jgi:flagellar motor switch protein FliM
MTAGKNNKAATHKLDALLSIAQRNRPAVDRNADAPLYDWNQARHFGKSALEKLDAFIKKAGEDIGVAVGSAMGIAAPKVEVSKLEQKFGRAVLEGAGKESQYCLAISTGAENCGFMRVTVNDMLAFLGSVLSDPDSASDTARKLSPLEESVLQDGMGAIVAAFGKASKDQGGAEFAKSSEMRVQEFSLGESELEEFCEFSMSMALGETKITLGVSLFSSALDGVVGMNTEKQASGQEDMQQTMLCHIAEAPIRITTKIATISLCLNDVMSLGSDDIIVFEQRIDDPVEIRIGKKPAFSARLAQSQGCWALQIEEPLGAV